MYQVSIMYRIIYVLYIIQKYKHHTFMFKNLMITIFLIDMSFFGSTLFKFSNSGLCESSSVLAYSQLLLNI